MSGHSLDRLLGELQQHIAAEVPATVDFTPFIGRPTDFAREICNAVLLRWQEEALQAMVDHDLLTIATCNGAGKTGGFSPLAMLYALFVEGATVIYQTSTEKQARQQILRELKRWIERSAQLECDVRQYGIELPGKAAIYLVSPGQMEALAGHHGEHLRLFVDEASALDAELFQALMGNIVADGNSLALLGNPLRVDGPFAASHRAGSLWWRRVVTAEEVIADPAAPSIRGLITTEGVHRLRQTFGEESSAFQSRVWARFPAQPTDCLYPEALLAAAVERWKRRELLTDADEYLYVGVDVGASDEGDETVVSIVRNGHTLGLHATRERDTMKTVAWITDLSLKYGIARRMPAHPSLPDWLPAGPPDLYNGREALFMVDEIGVGKGLGDRLAELGYTVSPFNAARRPKKEADSQIYANERARVAAKFRDLLIAGQVGIPNDPLLLEELRVYSGFTNQSGKLQCVAKEDLRKMIGRSPDRLDAVLLAAAAPNSIHFGRVRSEAVTF